MTGAPWRWAWISFLGARFLGVYGRDEHGFVFHAVVDLAATPPDQVALAARTAGYQAIGIWRLGAHEELSLDERLPPQIRQLNRRNFDEAKRETTVVLLLDPAEVGHYGLPEMY